MQRELAYSPDGHVWQTPHTGGWVGKILKWTFSSLRDNSSLCDRYKATTTSFYFI